MEKNRIKGIETMIELSDEIKQYYKVMLKEEDEEEFIKVRTEIRKKIRELKETSLHTLQENKEYFDTCENEYLRRKGSIRRVGEVGKLERLKKKAAETKPKKIY